MNTSEQFMYKRITVGTFVVNQDGKKYLVQTNEKKNYLDFCKFNKCDNIKCCIYIIVLVNPDGVKYAAITDKSLCGIYSIVCTTCVVVRMVGL